MKAFKKAALALAMAGLCAGASAAAMKDGLRLCAHEPFDSIEKAIEQRSDIHSEVTVFETRKRRLLVSDTDNGRALADQLEGLKLLMQALQSRS